MSEFRYIPFDEIAKGNKVWVTEDDLYYAPGLIAAITGYAASYAAKKIQKVEDEGQYKSSKFTLRRFKGKLILLNI